MLQKLKNKYVAGVAIGVGTAAVAATIYYKFFYKQKIELNSEGFLPINSVVKIFNQIRKESSADFFELVAEFRKKRRTALDSQEYLRHIKKFEESFENLLAFKQKQVLNSFGLEEKEFESSIDHYMKENNKEICALVTRIRQMLQDSIPPTHKLTREEFFKIMKDRIDYVRTKGKELYDTLDENLSMLQDNAPAGEDWTELSLITVVDNKIGDYIYEKYQVEREDLFAYQRSVNLKNDPELTHF